MGSDKLGRLAAGHLQLLERDDDSLADGHHEAEDEGALLLVAAAGLVGPPGQEGRVAPVTAREDEHGQPEGVRHGPRGEDGVDEGEQGADGEADGGAAADLVGHVARGDHEEEVDGADRGGDVVDLRDGVELGGLEVEGEVLDDVGAAGEGPEGVTEGEGVDLPGAEDAADDGPVELADGLAALLLDALAAALLLPVIQVPGGGGVRSIGEADL